MLFSMRYKVSNRPAELGTVEAEDMEGAVECGKEWCERNRARYIGMNDFVMVRQGGMKGERKAEVPVRVENVNNKAFSGKLV
jgi:hypothetical protein